MVILWLGLVLGCANRYRVTLSNDRVVTTHGKPRLNEQKTAYEFKDVRGQRHSVPVFRVKQIEPD